MSVNKNTPWLGKNIRYKGRRYIIIDVIYSCHSRATFLAEDIKTKVRRQITRKL